MAKEKAVEKANDEELNVSNPSQAVRIGVVAHNAVTAVREYYTDFTSVLIAENSALRARQAEMARSIAELQRKNASLISSVDNHREVTQNMTKQLADTKQKFEALQTQWDALPKAEP